MAKTALTSYCARNECPASWFNGNAKTPRPVIPHPRAHTQHHPMTFPWIQKNRFDKSNHTKRMWRRLLASTCSTHPLKESHSDTAHKRYQKYDSHILSNVQAKHGKGIQFASEQHGSDWKCGWESWYYTWPVPSDLGERKEANPQEPESDLSEDFEDPQLLGSLLRQHEARGHWPYDKGCDSCVQARGRTPARRRRHEGGDDPSPALTSMAADFTFVAGKYWRILVILMIHTGMMGMVVTTVCRGTNSSNGTWRPDCHTAALDVAGVDEVPRGVSEISFFTVVSVDDVDLAFFTVVSVTDDDCSSFTFPVVSVCFSNPFGGVFVWGSIDQLPS